MRPLHALVLNNTLMQISRRRHTRTLRGTSIFILVPPYFHYTSDDYPRVYLAFWGVCVFLASWMHWSKYDYYGARRQVDIFFASTYLVLELLTRSTVGLLDVFCIAGSLFFYSRACQHKVGVVRGLVAHLMFRYFAWISVVHTFIKDWSILAIWTLLYVTFALACVLLCVEETYSKKRRCET